MSTNTTEIQPGTIFVSHWGYEQTNVDFFEVVSATARTVQLDRLRRTAARNPAT